MRENFAYKDRDGFIEGDNSIGFLSSREDQKWREGAVAKERQLLLVGFGGLCLVGDEIKVRLGLRLISGIVD